MSKAHEELNESANDHKKTDTTCGHQRQNTISRPPNGHGMNTDKPQKLLQYHSMGKGETAKAEGPVANDPQIDASFSSAIIKRKKITRHLIMNDNNSETLIS
ncbi:hypothetical protein MJO29_008603 [Puccinia striiformis f. sp. tritici]|nr:hypothetical protein MJO29_008603 [Puccinia striiformis f. sp. tritici]